MHDLFSEFAVGVRALIESHQNFNPAASDTLLFLWSQENEDHFTLEQLARRVGLTRQAVFNFLPKKRQELRGLILLNEDNKFDRLTTTLKELESKSIEAGGGLWSTVSFNRFLVAQAFSGDSLSLPATTELLFLCGYQPVVKKQRTPLLWHYPEFVSSESVENLLKDIQQKTRDRNLFDSFAVAKVWLNGALEQFGTIDSADPAFRDSFFGAWILEVLPKWRLDADSDQFVWNNQPLRRQATVAAITELLASEAACKEPPHYRQIYHQLRHDPSSARFLLSDVRLIDVKSSLQQNPLFVPLGKTGRWQLTDQIIKNKENQPSKRNLASLEPAGNGGKTAVAINSKSQTTARSLRGFDLNEQQVDRIFERIEKQTNDCWVWTGRVKDGAPLMNFRVKNHPQAFRIRQLLYERETSEALSSIIRIKAGCQTENCVYPQHQCIFSVEEYLNKRSRSGQLKTYCKRGHELAGENVKLDRTGRIRSCRACTRVRYNEAYGK